MYVYECVSVCAYIVYYIEREEGEERRGEERRERRGEEGASPEREKGEELCPLVPPFSLLLPEEEELGLEVDALLENGRVLQSGREGNQGVNSMSIIMAIILIIITGEAGQCSIVAGVIDCQPKGSGFDPHPSQPICRPSLNKTSNPYLLLLIQDSAKNLLLYFLGMILFYII